MLNSLITLYPAKPTSSQSSNGGNWPSQTGNPSGGGRGNGPSKGNK